MALSISPAGRHQLKNALTAFSLGMLCFIRRWYDLENLQARGLDYFRTAPPEPTLLVSTIVAAIMLAALFWVAWFGVERSSSPALRKFAHCVFLLILIFPIESVRRYWNTLTDSYDWFSNGSLWCVELILAGGFIAYVFGSRRVMRPARRAVLLLLFLFPALMIDFLLNHLSAEQPNLYDAQPPIALLPSQAGAQRVVWVVFDEMDQHVAFDRRPSHLQLPELDRLRAESVVANQATQTSMWTAIALPSLLSGRMFTNAQALDANDLLLLPAGSTQRVAWRGEPNVFLRARELGVNGALIGWHHPYCRILGDQIAHCLALPSTHSTAALAQEAHATEDGVWRTITSLYRRQFQNLADMLRGRDEPRSQHLRDSDVQRDQLRQYFQIRDRVYQDAADARFGLVFAHFPTPHLFPIYNRRQKNFDLSGAVDYFDNLALVDRTVGELRSALEKTGLWDRTTLLITADHGLRPGAWQGHMGWTRELDILTRDEQPSNVPFILKLAGQSRALMLETPFSNVVCADLSLAILRGEVTTAEQAESWINDRARSGGLQTATGGAESK